MRGQWFSIIFTIYIAYCVSLQILISLSHRSQLIIDEMSEQEKNKPPAKLQFWKWDCQFFTVHRTEVGTGRPQHNRSELCSTHTICKLIPDRRREREKIETEKTKKICRPCRDHLTFNIFTFRILTKIYVKWNTLFRRIQLEKFRVNDEVRFLSFIFFFVCCFCCCCRRCRRHVVCWAVDSFSLSPTSNSFFCHFFRFSI